MKKEDASKVEMVLLCIEFSCCVVYPVRNNFGGISIVAQLICTRQICWGHISQVRLAGSEGPGSFYETIPILNRKERF